MVGVLNPLVRCHLQAVMMDTISEGDVMKINASREDPSSDQSLGLSPGRKAKQKGG